MADSGPDYTLRRPVDLTSPLTVIFHDNDDEVGGYFVQEDGVATKTRPTPSDGPKVRLPLSLCSLSPEGFNFKSPLPVLVCSQTDFARRFCIIQASKDVPIPVVNVIDVEEKSKQFSRPSHYISFNCTVSNTSCLRREIVETNKIYVFCHPRCGYRCRPIRRIRP